jgi:hypothetical protein
MIMQSAANRAVWIDNQIPRVYTAQQGRSWTEAELCLPRFERQKRVDCLRRPNYTPGNPSDLHFLEGNASRFHRFQFYGKGLDPFPKPTR